MSEQLFYGHVGQRARPRRPARTHAGEGLPARSAAEPATSRSASHVARIGNIQLQAHRSTGRSSSHSASVGTICTPPHARTCARTGKIANSHKQASVTRRPTPAQASRLPARANWPEGASAARCWRVGSAAHATCLLGCSGSKCTCDGMPVWSFRSRRACKRRASAAAASSLRRRVRCDAGEWTCARCDAARVGRWIHSFGGCAGARPLRCAEVRKCGRAGASRARPPRTPAWSL